MQPLELHCLLGKKYSKGYPTSGKIRWEKLSTFPTQNFYHQTTCDENDAQVNIANEGSCVNNQIPQKCLASQRDKAIKNLICPHHQYQISDLAIYQNPI